MSLRPLVLCWALCLALAACRGEPAPTPPLQVKFDLPAHKHMPACDLILQLHRLDALPEQPTSMAIANAGYLAVRDCPAALEDLQTRGQINLPLHLTPDTGLIIEADRLVPDTLSEAGLGCIKEKLTGADLSQTGALDTRASLYVQLKEADRAALP